MTPEQIKSVQDSFSLVLPIADQAASIFYKKLFELDPSLEALFSGDMEEQGKKLMKMLGAAVNGLNNLEELTPVVQELGKRHVNYGVKDKDYDVVGGALLYTLETGLGEGYSEEVKDGWVTAYTLLATVMKEAASEVPA